MTFQSPPGGSGEPGAPAPYEFAEPENKSLQGLASVMKIAGVFALVQGVFGMVSTAVTPVPPIPQLAGSGAGIRAVLLAIGAVGLLFGALTGLWTLSAGGAFQRAATTRGNDIPNVMAAVGSLQKYFTLMKWLIIAALILTVVTTVGAVIFVIGFAAR
jgi:hypothetical protein